MKVLLFTHKSDIDGMGNAILAKLSFEEVDYAILETSGKLSIFKREDDKSHTYPLPVIIDGKIQEDVLIQIGKDKKWIEESLKKEEYLLEDIFYGFYRNKRLFLIRNENIK